MKEFVFMLLMFSIPMFCLAEELAQPEQKIKNDQSYGTVNIQKQPQEGKQKQGIGNHFTFFTINIQVNGKIKDDEVK